MVPNIELYDGRTIPQFGLGLWRVTDKADFDRAFDAAIEAGYRHFDTAQAYDNEQYLGEAWQRSGIARNRLFITTKISVMHFGSVLAKRSFATSLKNLQTDYVDLLLLHFPVTGIRRSTWEALEQLKEQGTARSIGVSNYTVRHLAEMKDYARIPPVINQIELHVFLQQPNLVAYCREHDIAVEAYSPLAQGKVMDNPVIAELAQRYHKSYAQIMLRWCVQQGFVTIPKSVNPVRIRENIDIFDFAISREDMERLAALDRDLRTAWSPVHVP